MNRILNYPASPQDPARADLVLAREADVPLVIFLASSDLLSQIRQACLRQHVPQFHLLLVNVSNWNALLSCWPARNGETLFAGHGDITRYFMKSSLLPWALENLPAKPAQIWLGGYSLGGCLPCGQDCRVRKSREFCVFRVLCGLIISKSGP